MLSIKWVRMPGGVFVKIQGPHRHVSVQAAILVSLGGILVSQADDVVFMKSQSDHLSLLVDPPNWTEILSVQIPVRAVRPFERIEVEPTPSR
jgi:hypothetical protein